MATNSGKPAKKKSAGSVIISVLTIAVIAFAAYYVVTHYLLAAKHTIKIDDKVLNLRSSISEIQDQGFVLCNVNGKVITSLEGTLRARNISNTTYYIGVPQSGSNSTATCTGLSFKPANFTSQNQSLKKCTIYEIEYHPANQKSGVTVLIDDKDMSKATLEEWTAFLKEKGYPFTDKELEEFKTGKAKSISGSKDTHKYSANLDYKSKADADNNIVYDYLFGYLRITRDVQVKYS